MKRGYKAFNSDAQAFFDEVEAAIKASGLTMDGIAANAGMSKGWLRVHRYFGRPWQARIINTFCKGANASEKTRLRLHKLAVKALGYEV